MNLFQQGVFALHSGETSYFKIDCDALVQADWDTLARIASNILHPFSEVEGVPKGGLMFANSLRKYTTDKGGLLIADDVYTTGGSMEGLRKGRMAQGIVAFARRRPSQDWIRPILVFEEKHIGEI